jgi:SAM-dependent methyltransferase
MPASDTPERPFDTDIFDQQVEAYDAWYDSPAGAIIFENELDAIRPLLEGVEHPRLEVGVGTGRFAAALGVECGIDRATRALELAARRGIDVTVGRAEALPYPNEHFGAVLFVVTLCFVDDPRAALTEARRILRPDGVVVLGVLPAEGLWARHYRALAAQGDPYYQRAQFFSRAELSVLLAATGFRVERLRTALFWPPAGEPVVELAREGDDPRAGFLAMRIQRS